MRVLKLYFIYDTFKNFFAFLFCCLYLNATLIANSTEYKESDIIMLWPKDAASQDKRAMGTAKKPDRGDGHIRLTDITKPSMHYFPAPA